MKTLVIILVALISPTVLWGATNNGSGDGTQPATTSAATPKQVTTTIPDSDIPFAVGNFQLQITSVSRGPMMFAPVGMAEDETVLKVETKVHSGDPNIVAKSEGEFDVWITDENGRRNSVRSTMSKSNRDRKILAIYWHFGVAKSSESFYLHFPDGETVDLSPFLP